MIVSCRSKPEFSARALGIMRRASAKAWTPSFARPFTESLTTLVRCLCAAISNAPAPATSLGKSIAFFTERRPSRMASLTCAMEWGFCPLTRMVQLLPALTPSTKVKASSPRVSWYTRSAKPSMSCESSSTLLICIPPQASVRRSMLRRFARRRPRIPSLASMSRLGGSIPFWLQMSMVVPGLSAHTCFLNSMIWRTLSSVNLRSATTMFSRSFASL
mmetsp:Transcript_25326/g.71621  ORF Transcript_25326/g.71621 Transcript_25326/m.71621 type:complete len:217 (-) Transcript_25326:132-782(-)